MDSPARNVWSYYHSNGSPIENGSEQYDLIFSVVRKMEDTLYDPIALLIKTHAQADNELLHDILVSEYDQEPIARIIITGLESALTNDEKIYDILNSVFEIDPYVSVLELVATVNDITETIKRITVAH